MTTRRSFLAGALATFAATTGLARSTLAPAGVGPSIDDIFWGEWTKLAGDPVIMRQPFIATIYVSGNWPIEVGHVIGIGETAYMATHIEPQHDGDAIKVGLIEVID